MFNPQNITNGAHINVDKNYAMEYDVVHVSSLLKY